MKVSYRLFFKSVDNLKKKLYLDSTFFSSLIFGAPQSFRGEAQSISQNRILQNLAQLPHFMFKQDSKRHFLIIVLLKTIANAQLSIIDIRFTDSRNDLPFCAICLHRKKLY